MKTIPFFHIREFYARNHPDGHWFDRDTLKFFKSKLPASAYETRAGVLFITSETNPSGVKAFSIRRQTVCGRIQTVGEFRSYPTAAAARARIKALDQGAP
jgi:hypothetical protein